MIRRLRLVISGWLTVHRQREGIGKTLRYIQRNPQMGLSAALFCAGSLTVSRFPPLAGALFGAGASLLGAWITELHNRSSQAEKQRQLRTEARQYFAPELHRTIDRALYIHGRAIPNFISASLNEDIKTGDLKEDFIPYWPVLYPSVPQFRDLTGDEAVALVSFYDSLHTLGEFVNGWWEREGQLPVNIFNMILHSADKSLRLSLACIEKFDLEAQFPPPYEAWGTLSSRIERSLSMAEDARKHHLERSNSGAARNVTGATTRKVYPPRAK